LSGSAGTRSTDSWNSGNSTTWSPGFGGVLHTSLGEDSMSLTGVLGDLVMDELDDIESDGSSADSGEGDLGNNFLSVA